MSNEALSQEQFARATSTPEEGPDFDIDQYNNPIRPASGLQDTWAHQPWRGDYG